MIDETSPIAHSILQALEHIAAALLVIAESVQRIEKGSAVHAKATLSTPESEC